MNERNSVLTVLDDLYKKVVDLKNPELGNDQANDWERCKEVVLEIIESKENEFRKVKEEK